MIYKKIKVISTRGSFPGVNFMDAMTPTVVDFEVITTGILGTCVGLDGYDSTPTLWDRARIYRSGNPKISGIFRVFTVNNSKTSTRVVIGIIISIGVYPDIFCTCRPLNIESSV
jgi:hypothetical protein